MNTISMHPKIYFIVGISAFLLLTSSLLAGEIIKANSFQASSDGVSVTIKWVTEDESNVARFEVERSTTGDGVFTLLTSVSPKGASLYEVVDNSPLMRVATLYQYRIKVVFNDGSVVYTSSISVSHTVSGVRRTWGSIKSMFR
jgi:hypothetical protein